MKRNLCCFLVGVVAAAIWLGAAPAQRLAAPPMVIDAVVKVDAGSVRGSEEGGVASWKGIPFAAPPLGDLRWRATQPAAAWEGIRDAKAYGSDCMQLPDPSDAAPPGTELSEDCLYLNIWRTGQRSAQLLPVIVWIYGGGFINGGSSAATYTGNMLATSPLAQGLMQRAVIMSGGDATQLYPATLGDVEQTGVGYAESQGISAGDPLALAKLRALSAQQIRGNLSMQRLFDGSSRDFASPFVDGTVVVDQRAAYRSGAFTHVPVMIGATNADIGDRSGFMVAGARRVADLLAAHGVPVYSYRFSYVADSADHVAGAQHATDVPLCGLLDQGAASSRCTWIRRIAW